MNIKSSKEIIELKKSFSSLNQGSLNLFKRKKFSLYKSIKEVCREKERGRESEERRDNHNYHTQLIDISLQYTIIV